MDQGQVSETAKIVLGEVAKAKHFTETGQLNEIFLSAETIISGLAYLLSAKVEAEQQYRLKRVKCLNDGMTAAAAEAHAKASDEYVYWQKLEGVYDLGVQQTQLLKKFGPLLDDEYRRTK
ncbi:MAG TPA: hypothetical protein VKW08_00455 [Xanthobacteraceae bacterium]|jgi:hypothetical protein|nr:hypothetical protein [Xanthobacteraceae bacterium]